MTRSRDTRTAAGAWRTRGPAGVVRRAVAGLLAVLMAAAVGVWGVPAPAHAEDIRGEEWQLDALHVDSAWAHATGKGVTVAVLDSGVDGTHPDLSGRVKPGLDVVDGSTDGRKDPVGHGTSVADLIAGRRGGDGVAGVAYDASILPVRVLDANNRYGDATIVANGLRWAVDHGATVVNMSLGGAAESQPLADALRYAFDHDVVVVACAGNVADGGTQVWYPARGSGVIAVSGLGSDRNFWTGSLSGDAVALSAPADGLIGARPGGYWHVQGTSFAAPLVAGTAALIRSRWPSMSAANVVNRLISTADDEGPPGRDPQYGYGMVDPARAVTDSVPAVSANPLDTAPPSHAPESAPASAQARRSGAAAGGTGGLGSGPLVAIAVILLLATGGVLVLVLRRTHGRPRVPHQARPSLPQRPVSRTPAD